MAIKTLGIVFFMKEYRLIELKEKVSETLCLAKFHEATIWLYNSRMSGCHHTPAVIVGDTIDTFFNPLEKRQQQKEMIAGGKPSACNYCWSLENNNLKSDRELKSLSFQNILKAEDYLDANYKFKPKALELAFTNTCNLACSYCSPVYSTEWENDIKKFGSYLNLNTDTKLHYQRGIDKKTSVDMELFWRWFDLSSQELESIRITGGEPLLHEDTFKTFEKIKKINPNIECVIHTNLCQKSAIIDRFILSINKLSNVRINVSNEAGGEVAEFLRDGMIYSDWLSNVRRLCNETKAKVSISTTITALSLIGLDQLYLDIIKLDNRPYISINFATYPEFQSLSCLSRDNRQFYLEKYVKFFKSIENYLLDIEIASIPRILNMLNPSLTNENYMSYKKDADSFFNQYCRRRNKKNNLWLDVGKR